MAGAIRAHDWASTPLGSPETWPRALHTVLRIMLGSRYAMWLAWGPEWGVLGSALLVMTLAVAGFACMTPAIQALISRRSDATIQGEVLGVNQSASALARCLGLPFETVRRNALRLAENGLCLKTGLGYLIMDSRNAGNRYDLVIASMIIIGLIGLLLDSSTRLLERLKTVRWRYVR